MPEKTQLPTEIAWKVWDLKYRHRLDSRVRDKTPHDTWRRVARALARVETDRGMWEERFLRVIEELRFLPAGRILAGAGTGLRVTLFNCFVMGVIEDSMRDIFAKLKEAAITMQQGGGVGMDFSTLRPRGTFAHRSGGLASGPVSFMRIWDTTCEVLLSTSQRRGAMIATLRCDHPDIEEFVTVKRGGGALRHFNLSVQVSEAFLEAVRRGLEWPLVFPQGSLPDGPEELVPRRWTGEERPVPCRVVRRVSARELWHLIARCAYECGEPGLLFVDRINQLNNLWYREQLSCTNPCGEVPLPPYGSCNLGSVNLTRFVREPFTPAAWFDFQALDQTVEVATRMLDDVIDVSRYPLAAQAEQARGTRRLGLGLTGLADALILLGLHYGTPQAREMARRIMEHIRDQSYRTSVALSREKGPFPFFEKERYLEGALVRALPEEIRQGIARHGIRNSHLHAVAPAGSISLLAGNVSSGIEPLFALAYRRRLVERDGRIAEHPLAPYSLHLWRELRAEEPLPPTFVDSQSLPPEAHLEMQAALQPLVDSSISKTINLPPGYPFESFEALYQLAYRQGVKGCTVFRAATPTGAVLEAQTPRSLLGQEPERL